MKPTTKEKPWCFEKENPSRYRETPFREACYLGIGCWRCLSFMYFPLTKVAGFPNYLTLGWKKIWKVKDLRWVRFLCPWCVEEENRAWKENIKDD